MQQIWIDEWQSNNEIGQINEIKWNTILKIIISTQTQNWQNLKRNRQQEVLLRFLFCYCYLMFTTFKFDMMLFIVRLMFIYRWMLFAESLFNFFLLLSHTQSLNLNGLWLVIPSICHFDSHKLRLLCICCMNKSVACHTLFS